MTCPISLENIPVGDDGQPLNRAYAIVTPNGSQVYRRSNLTEHLRHHGNWWPHAGAGAVIVPDNVRASLGLPPRNTGAGAVNDNRVNNVWTGTSRLIHEMVRRLIGNAEWNVNALFLGGSMLHIAAARGHRTTVALLLESRANVNVSDNDGHTPLHLAAYRGHRDIVALLVDRGANVDAVDNYGETPLHLAVARGHRTTVEFLLERGANVSVRNRDGRTARNRATRNNTRALFNRR